MPANLENSAVATGLEKVRFHSNPQETDMQQGKWLSEEALQVAEKRREVKGKGERESYVQLRQCQRMLKLPHSCTHLKH